MLTSQMAQINLARAIQTDSIAQELKLTLKSKYKHCLEYIEIEKSKITGHIHFNVWLNERYIADVLTGNTIENHVKELTHLLNKQAFTFSWNIYEYELSPWEIRIL